MFHGLQPRTFGYSSEQGSIFLEGMLSVPTVQGFRHCGYSGSVVLPVGQASRHSQITDYDSTIARAL